MKIDISTDQIELTDAIKDYVEKKLGSLEHFFGGEAPDVVSVRVHIGKPSHHHHSGPFFVAEADMHIAGLTLRATSQETDLYAAIDSVERELAEQIRRFKDKQLAERRHGIKDELEKNA